MGDTHPPRDVRARGRQMASSRRRENEVFSCRRVPPQNEDGITIPRLPLPQEVITNGKTAEQLYQATVNRTAFLRKRGYKVIEAWSCEVGPLKGELPRKQTKTYQHAILYDFEAYGDKNYRKEPTGALTIENAHVPISESVGTLLKKSPPTSAKETPWTWSASS